MTGSIGNEAENTGHLYCAYRDGALMAVRRDGVEILRKTDASGVYTALTGTLALNIAQDAAGTGSFMEFLAYAASVPQAGIARIERYLAAKWGIALAPQVNNADAQSWINRVYTNGGTVSAATASAVNTFCNSIDAAGIRDRFYRLNLFCGNSDASLNAVRTPLYRGQSLAGTQFGNTIDTNVNFVAGDYAETGANGGLLGNGSTKYLNTGFATNSVPEGNRHIGAYECAKAAKAYGVSVGSDQTPGNVNGYWLRTENPETHYSFAFGSTSSGVGVSYTGGSMMLGVNLGAGAGVLYRNGNAVGSATVGVATPGSESLYVLALNRGGSPTDYSNARLGGYCVGLSLTAAQSLAYYNAMQAFQAALGRQV
jgi:hypothetical protein